MLLPIVSILVSKWIGVKEQCSYHFYTQLFVSILVSKWIGVKVPFMRMVDILMMLTPHSSDIDPSVDFGLKKICYDKITVFF